jgi:hypothetical protein
MMEKSGLDFFSCFEFERAPLEIHFKVKNVNFKTRDLNPLTRMSSSWCAQMPCASRLAFAHRPLRDIFF